ncbi:MAG TPA: 5-oxoprolinase subunit PxpB [Gemmatimonadales bacterium]|jgi:KipI family sensor histidine kinase inhibitor
MNEPRCVPLGDSALTLVFGEVIDPVVHRRILAVAGRLARRPPRAVREVVPAYTTIAIWFDPLEREAAGLAAELLDIALSVTSDAADAPGREWIIPVRYDGPDLAEVATRLGLGIEDVVRRHQQRAYRVFLLGFVPGFAFLGELDPALVLPRRAAPRRKVPAGSVAIAGVQTGVYPIDTPGGWHLIGRTDLALFDPRRDPPTLLDVGDSVRFEAVP